MTVTGTGWTGCTAIKLIDGRSGTPVGAPITPEADGTFAAPHSAAPRKYACTASRRRAEPTCTATTPHDLSPMTRAASGGLRPLAWGDGARR